MPNQPVPEESVELAAPIVAHGVYSRSWLGLKAASKDRCRRIARKALEAAAPALRKQEREQVLQELLAEAAKHRDRTRLRIFVVAALHPDQSKGERDV